MSADLIEMPKQRDCRHCHLTIFIGRGTLADQKAQSEGFCLAVCKMLFHEEMAYEMRREANKFCLVLALVATLLAPARAAVDPCRGMQAVFVPPIAEQLYQDCREEEAKPKPPQKVAKAKKPGVDYERMLLGGVDPEATLKHEDSKEAGR